MPPRDRYASVSPATAIEREVAALKRWFLALLLIVLALLMAPGCAAADKAILTADASTYKAIGREYEANLDAGNIRRLKDDGSLGHPLAPHECDEAEECRERLASRRRSLRAWKASIDAAR